MGYIKTLPLLPPRCRSAPHQLPPASAVCTLIRILLFPCLKLFLPLVTGIEFLNFRHKESGEGINDGLWQFDLV